MKARPLGADCHVEVTVEVSSNLEDWFSGPDDTLTNSPVNLGDGTELVAIEDVAVSPVAAERFMRNTGQLVRGG